MKRVGKRQKFNFKAHSSQVLMCNLVLNTALNPSFVSEDIY